MTEAHPRLGRRTIHLVKMSRPCIDSRCYGRGREGMKSSFERGLLGDCNEKIRGEAGIIGTRRNSC